MMHGPINIRLTRVMDNIHTCLQLLVALQQLPLIVPVYFEFLYSAISVDRPASGVTSDFVRYYAFPLTLFVEGMTSCTVDYLAMFLPLFVTVTSSRN